MCFRGCLFDFIYLVCLIVVVCDFIDVLVWCFMLAWYGCCLVVYYWFGACLGLVAMVHDWWILAVCGVSMVFLLTKNIYLV